MYFLSEEIYEKLSNIMHLTSLSIKVDDLDNLYFQVNKNVPYELNNVKFIFGKQNYTFLIGMLIGYLSKYKLSDIHEIDIKPCYIEEYKLRTLLLGKSIKEVSDDVGKAYISLLNSLNKVEVLSVNDINSKKYNKLFLDLIYRYFIFYAYWVKNREKGYKKRNIEILNSNDIDFIYFSQKNFLSALIQGTYCVSKINDI